MVEALHEEDEKRTVEGLEIEKSLRQQLDDIRREADSLAGESGFRREAAARERKGRCEVAS